MRHLLEEAFNNLMEAKKQDPKIDQLAKKVMDDHQSGNPQWLHYPKDWIKRHNEASATYKNKPEFTEEDAVKTAKNIVKQKKQIDEHLNRWNGLASHQNQHEYTQHILKHLNAAKEAHENGNHNTGDVHLANARKYMNAITPTGTKPVKPENLHKV